jgi:hypothetical protein
MWCVSVNKLFIVLVKCIEHEKKVVGLQFSGIQTFVSNVT